MDYVSLRRDAFGTQIRHVSLIRLCSVIIDVKDSRISQKSQKEQCTAIQGVYNVKKKKLSS
jgi:hypothetical protein